MAKKCEICGKGPMVGNHVSHAHNLTKRRWMPNIQRMRVLIDGQPKKVYVCTRCIRDNRAVKAL